MAGRVSFLTRIDYDGRKEREGEQGASAANEGLHDTRNDLNGDAYSRYACSWVEAGATIIGGCCGIGAAHIHRLRKTFLD